jgi:polar amino acid transport system substrate-binding protein
MIIDGTAADAFVQEYAGELVVNIVGLTTDDPLGFMFREGDENVDAFNTGLAAIQEDGTMDELVAKWFAQE